VNARWNSPPSWPAPPPGWSPPPGWQPDPSWPPAPYGWNFWLPVDKRPWVARHKVLTALGVLAALILLGALLSDPPRDDAAPVAARHDEQPRPTPTARPATPTPGPTAAESTAPRSGSTPTPTEDDDALPAAAAGPYPVLDVVDGDTIKVAARGSVVTVRLIGIDTPETKDPRTTVQCFGPQAARKASALLAGEQVWLEYDGSQGRRDAYGRTLAYVWLAEREPTLVNQQLIRLGFAHEYTYDSAYRYSRAFAAAESRAQARDRGLWSPETCDGDTTQPAAGTGAESAAAYANCDAARAAGKAPLRRGEPGYADHLDGDGDGVACESSGGSGGGSGGSRGARGGSTYYENCDAARAAGAAPVHRGDPGYGSHLDADGDGVGCE